MPLFTGIFASAISGNLTPADAGSMFPIGVTAGTGSSATISFQNIPSTYSHLQFRIYGVSTGAADWVDIRINNNTTTSLYRTHRLTGNGATAASADGSGQDRMYFSFICGATASPSSSIIDILDYKNTNKTTVVRNLFGFDANGSGTVGLSSGLWNDGAVVNRVDFILQSSAFASTTKIALYGVL